MKKRKMVMHICALMLAAGFAAVIKLPTFEAEGSGKLSVLAAEAGQQTESDGQEDNDGLIYVNDALYNGDYLDRDGILYTVSNGIAVPKSGTVEAGRTYYSSEEGGTITYTRQTVYVNGKAYTGYYLDGDGILYLVSRGTRSEKSGTIEAGRSYYSYEAEKTLKLAKQTVYVNGKPYTGYYLDSTGKMYLVSNGTRSVKNGTVEAGKSYYSYNAGKSLTLAKQTVYVAGKPYTGYYLDSTSKMYLVSNGTRSAKNGTVEAGRNYYSYNAGKTLALAKQTVYVNGKPYTGYYLDSTSKMYLVSNGTRSAKNGTVEAGRNYYSYNAGKSLKLAKQTVYVNGKPYTGYYLDSTSKMYLVSNGTRSAKNGTVEAGRNYYSYNAGKTLSLAKQTVYVNGKAYTGYYMDSAGKMYSVKAGTRTLLNTALNKGTSYYSYNAGKTLTLAKQTVYLNGKEAQGMSAESLATLQRAQKVVAGITTDSMTKAEKLKICFDYVKTAYKESRPRTPHYTGIDWPVIYANDMFVDGTGNCCSYAAAFAYMAKAIGYEEVYCCNSGGHGWAEIDGLIYDPEWSLHKHVYSYYAISYDAKTDQNYKGAIWAGYSWMRVKI